MQSILTYTIELVAIAFILLLALDLFATVSTLLQAVQPVGIYYQRLTLDNVPNRLDYLALILTLAERDSANGGY
ncbi:hypothetical protein [Chlorogloeopsis sp. ULAP02]|uniref:hypothetical protein n=1 Tax=Chlorogloeopsis sp. ULAP02 TaxID=3107926 RepID=UPI003136FF72